MAEVDVHQWKFLGQGNAVVARRGLTLFNIPNNQSIK